MRRASSPQLLLRQDATGVSHTAAAAVTEGAAGSGPALSRARWGRSQRGATAGRRVYLLARLARINGGALVAGGSGDIAGIAGIAAGPPAARALEASKGLKGAPGGTATVPRGRAWAAGEKAGIVREDYGSGLERILNCYS